MMSSPDALTLPRAVVVLVWAWLVFTATAADASGSTSPQHLQQVSEGRESTIPDHTSLGSFPLPRTGPAKRVAAPYFDKWKPGGCAAPGKRLHSARLYGFSGNGLQACANQGITWADGAKFPQPIRCFQASKGAVMGEVWAQDLTCMPKWGSFQDAGCIATGYRQYTAPLLNVPSPQESLKWCANTRATVQSVTFNTPTRCVKSNTNVLGYFYVADPCCITSVGAKGQILQTGCLPPGAFGQPLPKPPSAAPYDLITPSSTDQQLLQFMAWVFAGRNTLRYLWTPTSFKVGGQRQVALFRSDVGPLQLIIQDPNGAALALKMPHVWADVLVVPQIEATEATVQRVASSGSSLPARYLIPPSTPAQPAGYYSLAFPTGEPTQTPRLIVTPVFTGCTFVIGVAYGKVHMAHLQPRQKPIDAYDFLAHAPSLSQLMRDRGGLRGFEDAMGPSNLFTFGYDKLHGYEVSPTKSTPAAGYATLIGVVTSWTIYFVITLNSARSVLIDASDLACRHRLTPPDPSKSQQLPPVLPFDTSDCPAGGTAADCTGPSPGTWARSPSSEPLKVVSIFIDTSRVKAGSCVRLSLEIPSGTAPVIFAYINGVDQQRCISPGSARSGAQRVQMDFADIDPQKTYEFRIRGKEGAQLVGKATLTACGPP